MREFTKSMLSLSWAMSLFGLKQMASLFTPGSNTAGSFEAVTRSTEDQLGPMARSTFRTGDNLQRGLVDLAFSLFTFGLWQPNGGRGDMGRVGGWGSGGWGPVDMGRSDTGRSDTDWSGWGRGDAGQQGAWTQAGVGQQGGWSQAGMGQQAGWSPEGAGGGWQVGGGGGSVSDLTAQAMGLGIDLMQQGAEAVSQTLEGSSTNQPGDFQTSGGGSGRP